MPTPNLPLKLVNLYYNPPHCAISGKLAKPVFEYFFHHVLVGTPGACQSLQSQLFDKFYRACLAEGIESCYDPDNVNKIVRLLSRLNFNEPKPASPRRTNPSPAKPTKQSPSGNGDAGGTPSNRKKVPRASGKTPDSQHPPSQTQSGEVAGQN